MEIDPLLVGLCVFALWVWSGVAVLVFFGAADKFADWRKARQERKHEAK